MVFSLISQLKLKFKDNTNIKHDTELNQTKKTETVEREVC